MWAKRNELLQDRSVTVSLDPRRVVDTADFIARHARRYGIRGDLEFRRNHSGRIIDRHYVLCHHAGSPHRSPASTKPLWILHVVVGDAHPHVHVTAGLHTYRRWGRGVEAGQACLDYVTLLNQALQQLDQERRAPKRSDNVIPLRPFLGLPPQASA